MMCYAAFPREMDCRLEGHWTRLEPLIYPQLQPRAAAKSKLVVMFCSLAYTISKYRRNVLSAICPRNREASARHVLPDSQASLEGVPNLTFRFLH